MMIKPYLLIQKEEERNPTSKGKLIESLNHQTNSTTKNLIQEVFRRKDNTREEISHPYNTIIVIRWDTR
jgi:hypothetical protein